MPPGNKTDQKICFAIAVVISLLAWDAWGSPRQVASAQNPTPTDAAVAPELRNETRQLYVRNCAKCHGEDGKPRPIAKKAPKFTDPEWAPPAEKIQAVITNGKGEVMPKFKGRLSPEEVRDLADFLLSLKSK